MFADFDKVLVLNLDHRKDRWDRFQSYEWPFDYERWPAIDGKKFPPPTQWGGGTGAWGCYLSHLSILEAQIQNGWDKVFVFEDDAIPNTNFQRDTVAFFKDLPKDWNQIYLGGLHRYVKEKPPTPVTPNVVRCHQVNWAHAYGITLAYAKKLHQYLWESFHEHPAHYHIDWRYEVLHPKYRVYAPAQWTVLQGNSTSDILRNNKFVKVKGKQTLDYMRKLDRLKKVSKRLYLITGDDEAYELAKSLKPCNVRVITDDPDLMRFLATHNPGDKRNINALLKIILNIIEDTPYGQTPIIVAPTMLPYVPALLEAEPDIGVVDVVSPGTVLGRIRRSVYRKVGAENRHRFEIKGSFKTSFLDVLMFMGLHMTNRMLNAQVRRSEKWYES